MSHSKISCDYGIFDEMNGMSKRANIIIDGNGKVQWIKVSPSEQLPDINETLQILSNN